MFSLGRVRRYVLVCVLMLAIASLAPTCSDNELTVGIDDDTFVDDDTDDDVDDDLADDDAGDDFVPVDDDLADDDTTDDDLVDDDLADDDLVDDDTGGPIACEDYSIPKLVGYLGSNSLTAASGLAVSYKNPGVMWVHNHAGDGSRVYALRTDGTFLGVATLVGAEAVDWEDIAIGPCGADECIYIGDIGDDSESRGNYAVFSFIEPDVDPDVPFWTMTINCWQRYPFSYPDGPHDAEALAVHPDGSLYVFTKSPVGSSEMFMFPVRTPEVGVVLVDIGELDTGAQFGLTTAADIHRDGMRLLLRTQVALFEWRLDPGQPFSTIIDAPRRLVPSAIEDEGEAIGYDALAGGYLQTGIGLEAPVFATACK